MRAQHVAAISQHTVVLSGGFLLQMINVKALKCLSVTFNKSQVLKKGPFVPRKLACLVKIPLTWLQRGLKFLLWGPLLRGIYDIMNTKFVTGISWQCTCTSCMRSMWFLILGENGFIGVFAPFFYVMTLIVRMWTELNLLRTWTKNRVFVVTVTSTAEISCTVCKFDISNKSHKFGFEVLTAVAMKITYLNVTTPVSCWLLVWLTLWPWWLGSVYVPPKRRWTYTWAHGVTFRKTALVNSHNVCLVVEPFPIPSLILVTRYKKVWFICSCFRWWREIIWSEIMGVSFY
jgi:hypothetical protein